MGTVLLSLKIFRRLSSRHGALCKLSWYIKVISLFKIAVKTQILLEERTRDKSVSVEKKRNKLLIWLRTNYWLWILTLALARCIIISCICFILPQYHDSVVRGNHGLRKCRWSLSGLNVNCLLMVLMNMVVDVIAIAIDIIDDLTDDIVDKKSVDVI